MDEKYAFVSYAHKDRRSVQKEIKRREKLGQKLWYDKEIKVGNDWADSIAVKLSGASSVLYFESPASKKSENCRRELAYAREHGIPVESVNLGGPMGTIVGIIALAAAIYLVCYISVFKVIPNVTGFKTADAERIMQEYGFKSTVSYDYSQDYPLGLIMEQSLTGKTFPFIPISIVQSLGPEAELAEVPDTIGEYIGDGVRMLADAGITKFTITAQDSKSYFGTITYQSVPGGYKISRAGSIDLTVASGSDKIVFEYDGTEYALPSGGDSIIINTETGTSEYIEGRTERDLDNAYVITVRKSDGTKIIDGQVFDTPVVITGENGSVIAFTNCTFTDDVIIKTNTEEIMAGIEGTCTLNGSLCIINNIMESDIYTPLPKFVIETDMPVAVEQGSGTCFMLEKEDFHFNGKLLKYSDVNIYIDKSGDESTVTDIADAGENATMYFASQFMNKGDKRIYKAASNINVFPERNGNR